ncbi:hypothetical protein AB0393_38615 [Streptomyces cyaneofuscatus]|uniref:hypothetical protein n=1 Tax=Streptomyces cyaneofuscatus TaxID=66883 RepID=UPI00344B94DC
MTRAGSNDRKSKARKIARSEGIPLTEAHARLLEQKSRPPRDSAHRASGTEELGEDQEHEFGMHCTLADGPEVVYGEAAADAMWGRDDPSMRAACRCGWSNPHEGPRFPDARDRYGIEPAEQSHWRWYHLGAWGLHYCVETAQPTRAEVLADPSQSLHDLSFEFAVTLRSYLDHAQDRPAEVASLFEKIAAALAQERRRRTWQPHHGGQPPAAADVSGLPDDLVIGLQALLHRFGERHGPGELWLAQYHAEKLRRLVLRAPDPDITS